MSLDAFLAAGTLVKMEADPVGAADVFDITIPGITTFGAIGEVGEAKDKTTLSDQVKKYGKSILDTSEQNIKGQFYSTNTSQVSFVDAAKAQQSRKFEITWPDGTKAVIVLQLLGFTLDEVGAEDWQTFSAPARQSGATAWTAPV